MAPNLLFQVGGYVDFNRNKLLQTCLEDKSTTHLMFIDADMIFPDDGIYRLLQHDKDIVGGNYNTRLNPTSKDFSGPTVKMLVDGEPVSMTELPKGLFKCYAIATGFMMIKLDAVREMKMPVFEAFTDDKGLHHTEDVEFCKKANEMGLEVWCDPDLEIGHIGQYVY
jgi:GT2 family glycosyltransferase